MTRKNEKTKREGEKDLLGLWAEGFRRTSNIWQDSYSDFLKPWVESSGDLFEKISDIPQINDPKRYMEFYQDWMKNYENIIGKYYPYWPKETSMEDVQRMLDGAQELNKIFKSWSTELMSNTEKTKKMMENEPSAENIMETYQMWCELYRNIFDSFFSVPTSEKIQAAFENSTGIPITYMKTITEFSKLWRTSFDELYSPWVNRMTDLYLQSKKMSEGEVAPETYTEFYGKWMDAFHDVYQGMFRSSRPPREMLENLMENTTLFSEMYQSWQEAMEQMASRIGYLLQKPVNPETYEAFYEAWARAYDKAFEGLFEHMPMIEPMKEMIKPVKNAFRIYTDSLARMSQLWMRMEMFESQKE